MTVKILGLVVLLVGIAIASMLAGIGRKRAMRILNIPISAVLAIGVFLCGLYVYAKLEDLPFTREALLLERADVVVGAYIFLLVSVLVGLVLGAVESGGLSRYMQKLFRARFFGLGTAGFLVFNVVAALLCVVLVYTPEVETIRISEVCHHNFKAAADAEGNCSDYIELYNAGDAPAELSDYFLSDDSDTPKKFRLPDVTLAPGQYILVWADGEGGSGKDAGEIHANFRISDGETVVLSTKELKIVDTVNAEELPADVAFTRVGAKFIKASCTPGVSNEGCIEYCPATLSAPAFSLNSGFYPESSIKLELAVENEATIYYTTDGSIPNENSAKYEGTLTLVDVSDQPNRYVNIKNTVANYDNRTVNDDPVSKANVIRAIAMNDKGEFSPVVTGTFFVGEVAEEFKGYSVLSIVSDPENLFGENGIHVTGSAYDDWYNNTDRSTDAPTTNFAQRGKLWEREATIQLWDESGRLVLDQDCGIRIQGNASRGYALKRFSIYARDVYGDSDFFDAPLFGGVDTHSVYLRDDHYDIVVHKLLEDRESVSVQHGTPAVMFLDGEFYYITYIREKYDEEYFSEYYGVDAEDVVIITDSEADSGDASDLALYTEFLKFLEDNDCADSDIYKQISEQMDIQSFIDFVCTNLYMNNIDWSLYKNFKMWRTRSTDGEGFADGKWRWCIYDVDAVGWSGDTLGIPRKEIDPFSVHLPYTYHSDHVRTYLEAPIFSLLIQNSEFKQQFVHTYFDLMNTYFTHDAVQPILEEFSLQEHWLWKNYLLERPEYAAENVIRNLGLSGGLAELSVEVNDAAGGTVVVNTIVLPKETSSWTGVYVTDYPVVVSAVPGQGWEFAGWAGDISSGDETVTITLTEDGVDLEAVFVPAGGGY